MNQRLNDITDLTENEKALFNKLQGARVEYQNLSYGGILPVLESNQKNRCIPVSIAASIVTTSVLVFYIQSYNSSYSKPKFTVSKINVQTSFPTGFNRSLIINSKKLSLSAHKPATNKKLKSKFSMPMRPVKRTS